MGGDDYKQLRDGSYITGDRDGSVADKLERALYQAQDRVKELEAACAELVTDGNAVTLAANLAKQSICVKEMEASAERLIVAAERVLTPSDKDENRLAKDRHELRRAIDEARRKVQP